MEFFQFTSDPSENPDQAHMINGVTESMWVERYREAGEFKLTAPVSSGLRDTLPIGTLISHIDTYEVMIVENHEIDEGDEALTKIVITGRSIETWLEHRIVGSNFAWPLGIGVAIPQYSLASAESWDQVVELINHHILPSSLIDDDDAINRLMLPYTEIADVGISLVRSIPHGTVYERLQELLIIDDLGLRCFRPGPWVPNVGSLNKVCLLIHNGEDKTTEVAFSHDSGELETASYLWSNKKKKTSALVKGKWLATMIVGTEIEYERRVMLVDGSDIDDAAETLPISDPGSPVDHTLLTDLMIARGEETIARQNDVEMANVEISKTATRYVYRRDYNIGDIVAVDGNYGASSIMRVIEYVEIEDSTGESGYPTLSADIPGIIPV